MPPQPPAVNIQTLNDAEGWYVIWGATASGCPRKKQKIVKWALGTDGLTVEAIVVSQVDGTLKAASNVSTDYSIDHPYHWTRSNPEVWP